VKVAVAPEQGDEHADTGKRPVPPMLYITDRSRRPAHSGGLWSSILKRKGIGI
jgi:hypothetical protein